MKIITFPRMGDSFTKACFEAMRDYFAPYQDKIQIIEPAKINRADLNQGEEAFPELFCSPIKITMASLIKTIELIYANFSPETETAVIMFDSKGRCRLHTYWIHYNHAFRNHRLLKTNKIRVYPLSFDEKYKDFAKVIESEFGYKKSLKIVKEFTPRLLQAIYKADQPIINQQNPKNWTNSSKPKIGVIGEIYTVNAEEFNGGLLEKLKRQDAYTHIFILPSQFSLHQAFDRIDTIEKFRFLNKVPLPQRFNNWKWLLDIRREDINYQLLKECHEEAEEIFPTVLGGHGKASIATLLYYIKSGFDGVIHVLPFPCMPESTVSGILDRISQDYKFPLMHLIYDQNIGEADTLTRIEAFCETLKMSRNKMRKSLRSDKCARVMGIDLGSVTTKGAIIRRGSDNNIIIEKEVYLKTNRDPLVSIKALLSQLCQDDEKLEINSLGTTGSGRFLAQAILKADETINEITAQVLACREFYPDLRTIFEIGGQDSKVIYLEDGVPIYFDMNSICAAGTGAFLEKVAADFNLPLDDLNEMALRTRQIVEICGRCGIFACSDIITKQQRGITKDIIFKSVCHSLVRNYLTRLAKITPSPPIVFTGGVALNKAIVQALEEILQQEIMVFPHNKTSGAIGAALWASHQRNNSPRIFNWQDIIQGEFSQSSFRCEDCGNQCEVSQIYQNGICLATLGSRCRKYEI